MTHKEDDSVETHDMHPEAEAHGKDPEHPNEDGHGGHARETHMTMEVVDMRIEMVKHRKHERQMERTLRWPVTATSHKLTW